MIDKEGSNGSREDRLRTGRPLLQYSFRRLFGIFTLISACLAIVAWQFRLGLVLATILFSVVVAIAGLKAQRHMWMGFGITFALLAGIILAADMIFVGTWDGSFSFTFNITVQDAGTGDPIQNAQIGDVLSQAKSPEPRFVVDGKGHVVFTKTIPSGGAFSLFGITQPNDTKERMISLEHWAIHVEAPGYETITVSLPDACGESEWPMSNPNLPPIQVKLTRIDGS